MTSVSSGHFWLILIIVVIFGMEKDPVNTMCHWTNYRSAVVTECLQTASTFHLKIPYLFLPCFSYTDLNVLDWSRTGHLAIALSGAVYVLDTDSGGINHLCSTETDSLYVSSLQWNKTGKYLAVGTSDAEVQVCQWPWHSECCTSHFIVSAITSMLALPS